MSRVYHFLRDQWRGWRRRQVDALVFAERGEGVEITPPCVVENAENIRLGRWIYIGHGGVLSGVGGIWIGDNVSLSPGVQIHTSNHAYEGGDAIPYGHESVLKPVRIESHVWVGANALICPGVTIGEGAVVAMGAVVTRDVAPLTVVGGNPARELKQRDREHFERLKAEGRFYLRMKTEPGYSGPRYLSEEEWAAVQRERGEGG